MKYLSAGLPKVTSNRVSRVIIAVTASAFLFISAGCEAKKETMTKAPAVDSLAIKDSIRKAEEENFKITFHYFPDSGRTSYSAIKENFTEDQRKIILGIKTFPRSKTITEYFFFIF